MKCKNAFCRKTVFSFWGQFSKSKWLLHGQLKQRNSLFVGANPKTGPTEREHQDSFELNWSIFIGSDKKQCGPLKKFPCLLHFYHNLYHMSLTSNDFTKETLQVLDVFM